MKKLNCLRSGQNTNRANGIIPNGSCFVKPSVGLWGEGGRQATSREWGTSILHYLLVSNSK